MLLIKKIPFALLGFGLATAFAAVYGGPAVRELSRRTGIQLTHQISTPNSSLGGLEKTPRYGGRQAVRGNPLEKQSTSLLSKKKPGCSKRRAGDLCRLCKGKRGSHKVALRARQLPQQGCLCLSTSLFRTSRHFKMTKMAILTFHVAISVRKGAASHL